MHSLTAQMPHKNLTKDTSLYFLDAGSLRAAREPAALVHPDQAVRAPNWMRSLEEEGCAASREMSLYSPRRYAAAR